MKKPIPVILDTDIGSDIDDTWALVMLLKSPELDLKLITTEESDNVYKAKLCAKMCEIAGRTDIPVGIGSVGNMQDSNIKEWVEDYDLSTYPNVIEDGVQTMIDTIMASDEKIIILAIGPCKTLADAVTRCPEITKKSRIIGLHGNIYNGALRGLNWYPPLGRESNIWSDLESYRIAFEQSDWEIEMLPLDVSGCLFLEPDLYEKVAEKRDEDPLIGALMENCEIWYKNMNFNFWGRSSCLFDIVGIYAAFTHDNLEFEELPVYASDGCITLIDPMRGKNMKVALRWKDINKFYKFFVARLRGEI